MIGTVLYCVKALRFIPAYIVYKNNLSSEIITYEINRWLKLNGISRHGIKGFLTLMMMFPEFRSLIYYRTGCQWLRHLGRGQVNLYFHTPNNKIGKGLVIWHGYSTVINAESIGENCSIWHNVTIGKKTVEHINDRPTIGNNVNICTGAIIVGKMRIADDVTIGAGAIVVDEIEENNVIVVGVKASIKR